MNVNDFNVKKAGLLFFDMLNVYVHRGAQATSDTGRQALANAVRLRHAARKAGIPVMFAHANHKPDGTTSCRTITDTDIPLRPWPGGEIKHAAPQATAGSWEAVVVPELEVSPEDLLIPKYRWSAFHQTCLDLALRSRGIDTLLISGCATDIGVASTVFSARDMDYSIILVRDACSGTTVEANRLMMDMIFPRMARIRTTDQVLEMIEKQS